MGREQGGILEEVAASSLPIHQRSGERCKSIVYKLDGCIVWNACNTVFGSKSSAICAQAIYYLHCLHPTRRVGVLGLDRTVSSELLGFCF